MEPPLPFTVRAATEEDCAFLWDLTVTTMRAYLAAAGGWDDAAQERRFWCTFDPAVWHVVFVGDRSVGGFAVERHQGADYVADIQILPACQRRGIGSAIILALAANARARGVPLALQVLDTNPGARRLYERLGFTFVCPSPVPGYAILRMPAVTRDAGSRLIRRTARTPTPTRAPSHTLEELRLSMDNTRTPAADETRLTRREMLRAAGTGLLLLLPMLPAYAQPAGQWTAVGKATDFAKDRPTRVALAGGGVVYVTRHGAKALTATSAKCTHRGCEVGWNAAAKQFLCPCHGAIFAADGRNVQGTRREPGEKLPPLPTVPVRQTGDHVEVNLASIPPGAVTPGRA